MGYITNGVHFEITNHGKDEETQPEDDAIAQAYANAANGPYRHRINRQEEEPEPQEFKDPEPAQVIDLDVNPVGEVKAEEPQPAEPQSEGPAAVTEENNQENPSSTNSADSATESRG